MNPSQVFREAIKAVPQIKWALGVGGIVAVIAIIQGFHLDWRVAVLGTIVMMVLMVMLVIFARVADPTSNLRLPGLVLTWFSVFIVIGSACLLFTCVFFSWPRDLGALGSTNSTSKGGTDISEPRQSVSSAIPGVPTAREVKQAPGSPGTGAVTQSDHLEKIGGSISKKEPVFSSEETPSQPTLRVAVKSSGGVSLNGAEVLAVARDGTFSEGRTDPEGKAELKRPDSEPVTVFCAQDGFAAFYKGDANPKTLLSITLSHKPNGGAIVISNGTGYVPGLEGRLNPILDAQSRMYFYAENIAIDGGKPQPVEFSPGRPIRI
jgi:hypothetical protein